MELSQKTNAVRSAAAQPFTTCCQKSRNKCDFPALLHWTCQVLSSSGNQQMSKTNTLHGNAGQSLLKSEKVLMFCDK